MPYIKRPDREKFNKALEAFPSFTTKGELEYAIFYLQKWFMSNRPATYTNLHEAVYAATHCADEFRRRYLDAREDVALVENGDIKIPIGTSEPDKPSKNGENPDRDPQRGLRGLLSKLLTPVKFLVNQFKYDANLSMPGEYVPYDFKRDWK